MHSTRPKRFLLFPVLSLLVLGFGGLLACGGGGSEQGTAASSEEVDPQRIERIENGLLPAVQISGAPGWNLETRRELYGVPGLSVAVIDDFRVLWSKGYGLADPASGRAVDTETLFPAGFASRLVSAVVALSLVQDGSLDLDSPVSQLLSSWQLGREADAGEREPTVRDLLQHTAGLNVSAPFGYEPEGAVPTLAQVLNGESPAGTPAVRAILPIDGTVRPSSGGYIVLQQLLEDVTGQPFATLAEERVFQPLGMEHSTFAQPLSSEQQATAAVGHDLRGKALPGGRRVYPEQAATGLWTTPTDFARLLVDLQRTQRDDSGKVLNLGMVETMLSPVQGPQGGPQAALGSMLVPAGEAWTLQEAGGTAGFAAQYVAYRKRGQGVVVFANSDHGMQVIVELVRGVARADGWWKLLPGPVEPGESLPESLDAYTGRYQLSPLSTLIVTESSIPGWLDVREALSPFPSPLAPIDEHTFLSTGSGLQVFFPNAPSGAADAYVATGANNQQTSFPRLEAGQLTPAEMLLDGRMDEGLAGLRALGVGAAQEQAFNQMGYSLMALDQPQAALAVFELNRELHPDSFNVYDSLGEAYAESQQADKAIAAYQELLDRLENRAEGGPPQYFIDLLSAKARYQMQRLGAG